MVELYGDDLLAGIPMKCGGDHAILFHMNILYQVLSTASLRTWPWEFTCTLDGIQRGFSGCQMALGINS
jgi:hypothetical protein